MNTRSAVFDAFPAAEAAEPPPEPFCGEGRAGRPGEPPEGLEGGIGAAGGRVAAISPMSGAAAAPTLMDRASTVLSGRRRAAAAIVDTAPIAATVLTPSRCVGPPFPMPYFESCSAMERPVFFAIRRARMIRNTRTIITSDAKVICATRGMPSWLRPVIVATVSLRTAAMTTAMKTIATRPMKVSASDFHSGYRLTGRIPMYTFHIVLSAEIRKPRTVTRNSTPNAIGRMNRVRAPGVIVTAVSTCPKLGFWLNVFAASSHSPTASRTSLPPVKTGDELVIVSVNVVAHAPSRAWPKAIVCAGIFTKMSTSCDVTAAESKFSESRSVLLMSSVTTTAAICPPYSWAVSKAPPAAVSVAIGLASSPVARTAQQAEMNSSAHPVECRPSMIARPAAPPAIVSANGIHAISPRKSWTRSARAPNGAATMSTHSKESSQLQNQIIHDTSPRCPVQIGSIHIEMKNFPIVNTSPRSRGSTV